MGQAKAYGNFYNNGSIYAQNDSWQYDMKAGGNAVSVKTRYYFYKYCPANGAAAWCDAGEVDSPGSTSAAWTPMWTRKQLDPVAQNARGAITVCEAQSFSGDPCSVSAIASFGY